MGARSSNINRGPNNRGDGHLLSYFRNTFIRGGGAPIFIPIYSVSPSTSSVNEGSSVTFTTTTNVPNGTTLYWTLNTVSGTINASDFSGGATSGSFTVTGGTGSVVLTLANDVTTEGSESFQLQVRTGSTGGPIVATSSTVTIGDTSLTPFAASGGTVIDSGGFRIHVFTSPGSFVVSSAPPTSTIEYLVVAGGGGGGPTSSGGYHGGGGGAGGRIYVASTPISAQTYPITVGAGGGRGTNGSNSIFSSSTAIGGGGGGNGDAAASPGGSGGGAGVRSLTNASGTPGQGNPGGQGAFPDAPNYGAGGGGGSGASGSNGTTSSGGPGGIGSPTTWLPASYGTPGPAPGRYFAGGGGGSAYGANVGGSGGSGGGGAGAFGQGGDGVANTGGGGGGTESRGAQTLGSSNGGSGIVAIRYLL